MKRLLFFIGLLVFAALSSSCEKSSQQKTQIGDKGPPILLIGIDGFEWNVVLAMMRNGNLPVLKALMERGAYGILETRQPTSSPILWTTIATGKLPQKHGIKGFVHKEIKGTRPLYTNADRKRRPSGTFFLITVLVCVVSAGGSPILSKRYRESWWHKQIRLPEENRGVADSFPIWRGKSIHRNERVSLLI